MAAARRASLSKRQIAAAKCAVFILCAIPGAALMLVALAQDLFGAADCCISRALTSRWNGLAGLLPGFHWAPTRLSG